MVRGDAAGDQLESLVVEGQVVGRGLAVADVVDALTANVRLGLLQHGGRQVAGDHAGDEGREGQGGVAAAGGDIEGAPVRLGLRHGQQVRKIGPAGVIHTADVGGGEAAETLAREGLRIAGGHRDSIWAVRRLQCSARRRASPPHFLQRRLQ